MSVVEPLHTIGNRALATYLTREMPDGSLLEFEFAPAGYPKADGQPRQVDHRAYYITEAVMPPGVATSSVVHARRRRLESVTTLLDRILPKGGLTHWYEARGIEGAALAAQQGHITIDATSDEWVTAVRQNGLGADRALRQASGRGLNIHALLETYMRTGDAPAIADHPVEHRGYVAALCSWLLERDPQPEGVEELVCDPVRGYAGRSDLRARIGPGDGMLVRYDAKTQERAGIYSGAHLQVALYEAAGEYSGDPPSDQLAVVVFAADGRCREAVSEATPQVVSAALEFAEAIKPVAALCEQQNGREREARR